MAYAALGLLKGARPRLSSLYVLREGLSPSDSGNKDPRNTFPASLVLVERLSGSTATGVSDKHLLIRPILL